MTPKSAFDLLLNQRQKLSFGCPKIDEVIGKLDPDSGITELSGEAGSGKTQICLVLSLQCQLPLSSGGIAGCCAYLSCGEGDFPIRRLSQLASSFEARSGFTQTTLLGNIFINQCYSPEDVQNTLSKKLPEMCTSSNVKLLIVDSLAGLIRTEYDIKDSNDMIERTTYIFKFSQTLKWLADTFGLCIVVVNQVTASGFNDTRPESTLSFTDVKPALGLAWASCVNSRIMLYRESSCIRSTSADNGLLSESLNEDISGSRNKFSRRYISLDKSPNRPRRTISYEITPEGVLGVS